MWAVAVPESPPMTLSGITRANAALNVSMIRKDVSVLPLTTGAGNRAFTTSPSGAMMVTGR